VPAPTRRRTPRLLASVTACLGLLALGSPAIAADEPNFRMPFTCGETWHGSTRASHSPSSLSVDWNRDAYDQGKMVVASASGIVSSVVNLGGSSYGLYVVIDHGNGWTSLHAHLSRSLVVVGQRVDQGQVVALVGTSGGSSGPHLHYEQRLNRTNQHAVFDQVRFVYNSWLTSRNCVDVPLIGDWNGDGVSQVGTFRRRAAGGTFRARMPDGTVSRTMLGKATDEPLVGDWNGDDTSDRGVWTRTTRTFTLVQPSGTRTSFVFGQSSDTPLVGDWNGDGKDDVGVFRPSNATFYFRNAAGRYSSRQFGSVSSLPVVGDWDGNGRFEPGVYDPATTTFNLERGGTVQTVKLGTKTSLPVVGYWNAGLTSDLGVWNSATGTFFKRYTPTRITSVRFGKPR
jgi:hypothetical protein